jgi:hypothetical protein
MTVMCVAAPRYRPASKKFDAAPPELNQAVLERMEALAGHAHEHAH